MILPENIRDELAEILETVARDGLPGPRDLDVALEAVVDAVRPIVDALHDTTEELAWLVDIWESIANDSQDEGHLADLAQIRKRYKTACAVLSQLKGDG